MDPETLQDIIYEQNRRIEALEDKVEMLVRIAEKMAGIAESQARQISEIAGRV